MSLGKITVRVDNETPYDLQDYQIKIELNDENFLYWHILEKDNVCFTLADEQTELPFWCEQFSKYSRKAVYWVKVPYLKSNSYTIIKMFFGAISSTHHKNPFDYFASSINVSEPITLDNNYGYSLTISVSVPELQIHLGPYTWTIKGSSVQLHKSNVLVYEGQIQTQTQTITLTWYIKDNTLHMLLQDLEYKDPEFLPIDTLWVQSNSEIKYLYLRKHNEQVSIHIESVELLADIHSPIIVTSTLVTHTVNQYIETFISSGSQRYLNLQRKPIIPKIRVFVNEQELDPDNYTVDYNNGIICLREPPRKGSKIDVVYYHGSFDYVKDAKVTAYYNKMILTETKTDQFGRYTLQLPPSIDLSKIQIEVDSDMGYYVGTLQCPKIQKQLLRKDSENTKRRQ